MTTTETLAHILSEEPWFLVIGQEDGIDSKLCRESDLLETVLGVLFYDIKDCPTDEREYWCRELINGDNWHGDKDSFSQDIGEIAHLHIWRVTDNSPLPALVLALQESVRQRDFETDNYTPISQRQAVKDDYNEALAKLLP